MLRIIQDDLCGLEIAALLQSHLDAMLQFSPPGSVHALDLNRLRHPEITFFTAWIGADLALEIVGCGAIRELDAAHGEVKSMRTAAAHLRKGVASAILTHIIAVARQRKYSRLSLETGSGEPFEAAARLYERFRFVPCGSFESYQSDSFSRFFTLTL